MSTWFEIEITLQFPCSIKSHAVALGELPYSTWLVGSNNISYLHLHLRMCVFVCQLNCISIILCVFVPAHWSSISSLNLCFKPFAGLSKVVNKCSVSSSGHKCKGRSNICRVHFTFASLATHCPGTTNSPHGPWEVRTGEHWGFGSWEVRHCSNIGLFRRVTSSKNYALCSAFCHFFTMWLLVVSLADERSDTLLAVPN